MFSKIFFLTERTLSEGSPGGKILRIEFFNKIGNK